MDVNYGTATIQLNKNSYLIREEIKGRVDFETNMKEGQGLYPYDVFVQIICSQKIQITFNNKTLYQIDNEKYVVKEIKIGTQKSIQSFYADFNITTFDKDQNENELKSSLIYQSGPFDCQIQYFVNVVFRKSQKVTPIICVLKEFKITTQYKEYNTELRDIITSYSLCGFWKRPIFFVMKAKRSHDNVELTLKIDQKYSNIKLNFIDVHFFQEFIINCKSKKNYRKTIEQRQIYFNKDTLEDNIIFDIEKVPSQTLTKNIALQYYFSIICKFNQCNGMPDQEIIVPIQIENSEQMGQQNNQTQISKSKFNKIQEEHNVEVQSQLQKNIIEWQNRQIREFNEKTIVK